MTCGIRPREDFRGQSFGYACGWEVVAGACEHMKTYTAVRLTMTSLRFSGVYACEAWLN